MQRVQILLDEKQQKYLARVSKKRGKSVSALIRELVDEKMSGIQEARLAQAARDVRGLYETQSDLAEFNSLDSEDWYA